MLRVIFEDDSLMVLDKPPGLVVTRADTIQGRTLEDQLKEEFGISIERGGIVHRLDKDTSGLMVVAKTQPALDSLQAQFKSREVKKEYLALVHGLMAGSRVVEGAIARNPGHREKFTVVGTQGKEAVTEFKPIQHLEMSNEQLGKVFAGFNKIQMRKLHALRYTLFTLVECWPKTGRTHQIRVHLKHIGFAIVGDEKYGGRKIVRLDHRWCPRQFLHAAKLEFVHPVSGERISFESKLPEDLQYSWKQLTPYLSSSP